MPQRMPAVFGIDMAQAPTVVTVGGPVIIVAAVLTIMFNADAVNWLLTALLGFIPRIRPVLKTALSYPLADRFRTGMTMALFAMIMKRKDLAASPQVLPDLLRQKIAYCLSQIFVVSQNVDALRASEGVSNDYDQRGGGSFGNFRDLQRAKT